MQRSFFPLICLFCSFLPNQKGFSQCDPIFKVPLSSRPANYDINVTLDDGRKMLEATQQISFSNQSPVAITEVRLYLYLNSFKNSETTFLKGAPNIFGQSFSDRKKEEWGWVEVTSFEQQHGENKENLNANMHFIQPDDGNKNDQSVLEVTLPQPLLPGETAIFKLAWHAQIPRTIARAGYNKDFFLLCHWFPQLGVFEQNLAGEWGWNCHQFMRQTEFFADFGVYDVHITASDKFVMGASGCLVEEKNNRNGTTTRHYHAEDVIDFAWSVYPYFMVMEEQWKDVTIRLLIPPEHQAMGPRYLEALKFALEYLDKHVGKYPYPMITVVDPPFHGLRSGLMEYPTFITAGTFHGTPKSMHNSESLAVHEFVHQYFMGMVASNEKEEPWLDEGFVTYFEDRIIDAAYGDKKSLMNLYGYRFDNRELSRVEYTTMHNPREGAVARPGWEFTGGNRKSLIYSKTATTLRTLQNLVGDAKMDSIIMSYFEHWKFKHPKGRDFMALLKSELNNLPDSTFANQVYQLFETSIYDARVLDYAVTRISNHTIAPPKGMFGEKESSFTYLDGTGAGQPFSELEVHRNGDWVFPVEILVTYEDGSTETLHWSGEEGVMVFTFYDKPKIVSAQVDPNYKLSLDIDINNNSMTLDPNTAPLWKYAAKVVFWIQNIMQTVSFLS